MNVDELIMAALHLEKQAKLLVEVAEKLYGEAIRIAIDTRANSKPPIDWGPVPANREETE